MSLETLSPTEFFQLLPVGASAGRSAHTIKKRRVLVGRSQACDICVAHKEVTAIHCVIERIAGEKFRVYDMDSTNGTYINGEKVLVDELSLGDKLKLGPLEFEFRRYSKQSAALPPLDMLDPELPPRMEPSIPPVKKMSTAASNLPDKGPELPSYPEDLPRVNYPLASDPKANYSEYIFEDVESLYPIFNYEFSKAAVEVIILHKDRIFSVDYVPMKEGKYQLKGSSPGRKDIEFAYLGDKEAVDFIEVQSGSVSIHSPYDYECLHFSEGKEKKGNPVVLLGNDDILRFKKADLQIYVRLTDAPPEVKPAPVFRRDKELRKYLLLMLLLVGGFMSSMSLFEVDEELEKEKAPERIASILYKRKLSVAPKPVPDKTKNKPKNRPQKSPEKKVPEKPKPKVTDKKQQNKANQQSPKSGEKTAKSNRTPKKAEPNKGPTNTKTTRVKPRTTPTKRASARASSQSQRKSQVNRNSPGRVETFKSPDFTSNLTSLLAKGGSTSSFKATGAASGSVGDTSFSANSAGATIRDAKVDTNVGSLTGAATGTLDATKGVQGLVNKKSIYTAGLPFKEVVLGGMDPDTIRRILIDNIPLFRQCYQRELDRSLDKFDGIVRLDFIIGAAGNVTKAGVRSASTGLPGSVKKCVVKILYGIKFPEPLGGGVVEVNQPFNFYPKRR